MPCIYYIYFRKEKRKKEEEEKQKTLTIEEFVDLLVDIHVILLTETLSFTS
jgi:hypothetical protein